MSDYLNLDLSNVQVSQAPERKRMFQKGNHEVFIRDAEVKKTNKGGEQLEVSYENDTGWIKQWIMYSHPTSAIAANIGKETLKKLLVTLGYEGNTPPSVDWFKGKAVEIYCYPKNDQNGEPKMTVGTDYKAVTAKANPLGDLDDEIPFG